MPKITILTAAHIKSSSECNWLREAIVSVRRQTFTDWEMIVVDDLSPHHLAALQDEFGADERIRWFRTPARVGPAIARNTAVSLSESEAIIALDADDMLADGVTLDIMYRTWKPDKKLIIYGFLQLLEEKAGIFQLGKPYKLPAYSFQGVTNLNGLMPVTALHSKECHRRAGGWKPELEAGLEDVEYWISAGKAGFCGQRIPRQTLLYRKHEGGRAFQLKNVNMRKREMEQLIVKMHADIFEGRFPVGCCGGGGGVVLLSPKKIKGKITTLDTYPDNEKMWVEYKGPRPKSFKIIGPTLRMDYLIEGPAHKFEIHQSDQDTFRRAGDFIVDIPVPPSEKELAEMVVIEEAFNSPAPKLTPVERIIPASQPIVTEIERPSLDLDQMKDVLPGSLQALLVAGGWTISALAGAEVSQLIKYRGIGKVTANKIIQKARGIAQ